MAFQPFPIQSNEAFKHNQCTNFLSSNLNELSNQRTKCLLALQHPGGGWRHAVDAPVRVAVLVADGDAEPAVVGPDDPDGAVVAVAAAVVAVDPQLVVLAAVGGPVLGAVGTLA